MATASELLTIFSEARHNAQAAVSKFDQQAQLLLQVFNDVLGPAIGVSPTLSNALVADTANIHRQTRKWRLKSMGANPVTIEFSVAFSWEGTGAVQYRLEGAPEHVSSFGTKEEQMHRFVREVVNFIADHFRSRRSRWNPLGAGVLLFPLAEIDGA